MENEYPGGLGLGQCYFLGGCLGLTFRLNLSCSSTRSILWYRLVTSCLSSWGTVACVGTWGHTVWHSAPSPSLPVRPCLTLARCASSSSTFVMSSCTRVLSLGRFKSFLSMVATDIMKCR